MSRPLSGGDSPASAEGGYRPPGVHVLPIASLLSADSPRVEGEVADHVRALAECEAVLPPIVVHWPSMRIVDGMHRVRAAELRGEASIAAQFVGGGPDAVFALSVRLNAKHGMPLTRADRLAAVNRLLLSHPHWSDRRIAELTGLSASAVGGLRRRSTVAVAQSNTRTGRDGRSRPLNAAEGRRRAGRIVAERPDASLREIASGAGVALATARDVRERMRRGQDPVPPKLRAAEGTGAAGQVAPRECPASSGRGNGIRQAVPFPEPAPPAPPATDDETLRRMRKDPSLRFTEAGRELLILLKMHSIDSSRLQWLIEGVPAHRSSEVARAARQCADRWMRLAQGVEMRLQGSSKAG
ncbi:MAG TPA: hypothetical protein VE546_14580 [Streptomyces sp.]|uniref:hypothetical protein n=1 Tax=Streptomyces sp. TaxID=1931 RepID=UPI002D6C6937|nr:hypothetical protein [Streptomyces sp.]HZG04775.1 hypothetical protein [Streptomyces sp.]